MTGQYSAGPPGGGLYVRSSLLSGAKVEIAEADDSQEGAIVVTVADPEAPLQDSTCTVQARELAAILFRAAGDPHFSHTLCVSLGRGLAVGVRARSDFRTSGLLVCATLEGSYLDPNTLAGPPSGDDKLIIAASDLPAYLWRVSQVRV